MEFILFVCFIILFFCSQTVDGQPEYSSTRSLCSAQVSSFVGECGVQEQYNKMRGYVNTRNNTLALNGWDPVCCDQLRFIMENKCIDDCYNTDLTSNQTVLATFAVYSAVCVASLPLPACLTQQTDIIAQQDACEDLSQRLVQTCGQEGRDRTQNLNDEVACCWSNECCDLSQQYLVQNCRAECSQTESSFRGLAEGISRSWLSACSLNNDLLTCGVQQALSIKAVDFSDESAQLQESDATYSYDSQPVEFNDSQQVGEQSGCSREVSKEEFIDSMQLTTYNRTISTFCVVNEVSDLQDMQKEVTDTCCTLAQTIISSSCQYSECFTDPVEILSQQTYDLITLWETICIVDAKSCDYKQALQQLTIPPPKSLPSPSPSIPQYPKLDSFQQIVRPVSTSNPSIRQESTQYTPQITFNQNQQPTGQLPTQQQNAPLAPNQQTVPLFPQTNPQQQAPSSPLALNPPPGIPFGFPPQGGIGNLPGPRPPPVGGPPRGHPPGFPSIVDVVSSGNAAVSSIFEGLYYIPELQGFNLVMSLANMKKQTENFRPITILAVESEAFSAFQKSPAAKILTTGSNEWNRTFQTHIVLERLDTQVVLEQGQVVAKTLEGGGVTLLGYENANEINVVGCCSEGNRAKVLIVAEFQDGVLWVIDKMLYPNGVAQQVYG